MLTAYKGALYEENFKIELLQHRKTCSCLFVVSVKVSGQWYIAVYSYKVHKMKTKIISVCRRARGFKVVFRNFVLNNESSIYIYFVYCGNTISY